MDLLIASTNGQKVLEIRQLLHELAPGVQLLTLHDCLGYQPSDAREANTKAHHAAMALGKAALADDSGIVVPVLGAGRYPSGDGSAIARTKRLLQATGGQREINRTAYLECCLALVLPDGTTRHATARVEGILAEEERGRALFEFDTIFCKHDYSKTLAELAPSVRARISHRRKALQQLLPLIERL